MKHHKSRLIICQIQFQQHETRRGDNDEKDDNVNTRLTHKRLLNSFDCSSLTRYQSYFVSEGSSSASVGL